MKAFVHASAWIEDEVLLGEDTSVWDGVHIRRKTTIGRSCIVGEKTHISYAVSIGDFVKINAFVYICTAVVIEDGVMISAGCIFTNDRYPRATNPEVTALLSSAPDEHTLATLVRTGATIGAGSIVGPGVTIGRFAMIGMGSVVVRPVPDFALMSGNPARCRGYVCRCGAPVIRFGRDVAFEDGDLQCQVCGRGYSLRDGHFEEKHLLAVTESLC